MFGREVVLLGIEKGLPRVFHVFWIVVAELSKLRCFGTLALFHNGVLTASQMEAHCISNERAREALLLRELGLAVGSSLSLCGSSCMAGTLTLM